MNVSGNQLTAPGFAETVEKILNEENYPPENLYLEITENVFLEKHEETLKVMNLLNKKHVRFKLDDFGTGYSSLSYLHRFPFDVLKIDKAFVSDSHIDSHSRGIVRTVIALGHTLGMSIVAEGIEEESHHEFLRTEGCEEGQGYLFSRPVGIDRIKQMILEKKQPI